MHVLSFFAAFFLAVIQMSAAQAENRPSGEWGGHTDRELERICGVYFDTRSDQQFCQQNALDYRSVASCGRSLTAQEARRFCVGNHTTHELMDTCDRYLVAENHLLKCIWHTKTISTIHKCAEDNNFRPAKIHMCLNFLSMQIENRDFDFDFSTDANIHCTRRNGENVLLKTVSVRRGDDGRLYARYKIDSGFFLTPNESSKWFQIPNSAFQGMNRSLAWKLASGQELANEDATSFFNRLLLPIIRQDVGARTVISCQETGADLAHPSPARHEIFNSGRVRTPPDSAAPVPETETDPTISR